VKSASKNEDLIFWRKNLDTYRLPNGEKSNTIEVRMRAFGRGVFTVDPDNIKAVLTGQFNDFGKGERFHEEWRDFLGDSIFATDGELWSRSRHLIRPMFNRDRIVNTEMFETHVEKLIRLLEGGANPNGSGVVDVGPLFFRFTLDAATAHLLGQPVNSLDNPKTVFSESFQYVLHRQSQIVRFGKVQIYLVLLIDVCFVLTLLLSP
jgi:cytochrome P450